MAKTKVTWSKRKVIHNKMIDTQKEARRNKAKNMMVHVLLGNDCNWKASDNTITNPKNQTYTFDSSEMQTILEKVEELKNEQAEYAAKKTAQTEQTPVVDAAQV